MPTKAAKRKLFTEYNNYMNCNARNRCSPFNAARRLRIVLPNEAVCKLLLTRLGLFVKFGNAIFFCLLRYAGVHSTGGKYD